MNPYWGKNFGEFFGTLLTRFFQLFSGGFSQLASDEIQLLTLTLLAIASSLVGVFLVLKRMTMLANSLSHTVLLGIVIAYLVTVSTSLINLQTLVIGALVAAFLTALLTQMLTHLMKVQEDASIGLVFSSLFALGVVLVTLYTRSLHMGSEAIMGNVDALHFDDLKRSLFVCLVNFVPLLFLFKEFKVTAFDVSFAKSIGFSPSFFNYFLMIQVAITAIAAFRAVGVLLFLILLVGPVLTARLFTHRLNCLILLSATIGAGCSVVAVALSRHVLSVYEIPLSTAGLLAVVIALFFLVSLCIKNAGMIVFRQKV